MVGAMPGLVVRLAGNQLSGWKEKAFPAWQLESTTPGWSSKQEGPEPGAPR